MTRHNGATEQALRVSGVALNFIYNISTHYRGAVQ